MKNGTIRKALIGCTSLLLLPASAFAHLSSTGLGPYYDGLTHFWRSPEELIPALALAFLAGLRGPRAGRYTLFALPGAWFVGGLVGLLLPKIDHSTPLECLAFLLFGVLVAADAQLRPTSVAGLASVFGFVFGYFDGAGMSLANLGTLGLVGSVSSLFVLVALGAALVASLHVPWTRIVVRVAGSWIAAAGLLLIGWAFHSTHRDPRTRSSAIQQQAIPLRSGKTQTP